MKITNKMMLPKALERIAEADSEEHTPKPHMYSVTELLNPTKQIVLTRQNYESLEEDVSDNIPAMFGTAVHALFQANDDPAKTEVKMSAPFGKTTVSGVMDRLDLDACLIEDYKTCSASKVQKEDYEDWRKQGMSYAALVWLNKEVRIKTVRFYALMKDWSKVKAASSPAYPQSAVKVIEFKVSDSDIEEAITRMVAKVAEIEGVLYGGNPIPECTDEEKWKSPTKYAVYKKEGDKRALKVCDSREEAEATKPEGGSIEERVGECLKCRLYCSCRKICGKEVSDD